MHSLNDISSHSNTSKQQVLMHFCQDVAITRSDLSTLLRVVMENNFYISNINTSVFCTWYLMPASLNGTMDLSNYAIKCKRVTKTKYWHIPGSLPLSVLCWELGGWLSGPGVPWEPGDLTSSFPAVNDSEDEGGLCNFPKKSYLGLK